MIENSGVEERTNSRLRKWSISTKIKQHKGMNQKKIGWKEVGSRWYERVSFRIVGTLLLDVGEHLEFDRGGRFQTAVEWNETLCVFSPFLRSNPFCYSSVAKHLFKNI